jgi:hypothetical protein
MHSKSFLGTQKLIVMPPTPKVLKCTHQGFTLQKFCSVIDFIQSDWSTQSVRSSRAWGLWEKKETKEKGLEAGRNPAQPQDHTVSRPGATTPGLETLHGWLRPRGIPLDLETLWCYNSIKPWWSPSSPAKITLITSCRLLNQPKYLLYMSWMAQFPHFKALARQNFSFYCSAEAKILHLFLFKRLSSQFSNSNNLFYTPYHCIPPFSAWIIS